MAINILAITYCSEIQIPLCIQDTFLQVFKYVVLIRTFRVLCNISSAHSLGLKMVTDTKWSSDSDTAMMLRFCFQ